MEEPIVIGLDELTNALNGEDLNLNANIIDEGDGAVTVLLDPSSSTIVSDSNSPTTGLLSDDIIERLNSFGVKDLDRTLLYILINKIKETVKNLTNLNEIPDGLHYKIVDAVCAEYLGSLYAVGKLKFEISAPISSVKEGDTEVSFAISSQNSPQKLFETILENMKLPMSEIVKYRVFTW